MRVCGRCTTCSTDSIWLDLPGERALLDRVAPCRLVRIDLGRERMPHGSTPWKSRRMLDHGSLVCNRPPPSVMTRGHLNRCGAGMSVDAMTICAPR